MEMTCRGGVVHVQTGTGVLKAEARQTGLRHQIHWATAPGVSVFLQNGT